MDEKQLNSAFTDPGVNSKNVSLERASVKPSAILQAKQNIAGNSNNHSPTYIDNRYSNSQIPLSIDQLRASPAMSIQVCAE